MPADRVPPAPQDGALSVVIPTRNRPDDARRCVESVLAVEGAAEIVVVDQSDDGATAAALADLAADGRIRHVRSDQRGAANARNEGYLATTAAIVAFTDDDCRVDGDWACRLLAVFAAEPGAALVFGRVRLPEGMADDAFAASFEPAVRRIKADLPPPAVPWGIGANMAVRRDVFGQVGMLDAMMGPGAFFPAGEESDLMVRVVAAGHEVVNASEASVLHLGVRSGHEASALVRGYAFGLGGVFCKHLRLRTRPGRWLLPRWLGHFGRQALARGVRNERPTGAGFATGLLRGAWAAARIPVDRRRGVFASTSAGHEGGHGLTPPH